MSLVTASETDTEQTESRTVTCVEMWCIDAIFGPYNILVEFHLEW